MLRTILVTIMLAGLATTAVAETVYKWVDTRGQVYYTDRPPTQADAKLLGVFERDPGLVDEETDQDEGSGSSPPVTRPVGQPAASSATVAGVQQDLDKARSEQCKQAQERYKTYVESRRLFREDKDGQRVYLSDEELMKARIAARQAVDEYCS